MSDDFEVTRPRGGTEGKFARQAYVPRHFEPGWEHFRQFIKRKRSFPANHQARARVDVSDTFGHVLESHYISEGTFHELNAPGGPRDILYRRIKEEHEDVFIFFNALASNDGSSTS